VSLENRYPRHSLITLQVPFDRSFTGFIGWLSADFVDELHEKEQISNLVAIFIGVRFEEGVIKWMRNISDIAKISWLDRYLTCRQFVDSTRIS